MGAAAQLPGAPHAVFFPASEPVVRDCFESVTSMARAMPWILGVEPRLPPDLQYDLDLRDYFRGQEGHSIMAKFYNFCGVYEVPPPVFSREESPDAPILIMRTLIQRNTLFPWREVLQLLGSHPLIFIGSPDEYHSFRQFIPEKANLSWDMSPDWGGEILRSVTKSPLCITNSSPLQILAELCHCPTIAEVSLSHPDNIYLRPGAWSSYSGKVVFPSSVPVVGGVKIQGNDTERLSDNYMKWEPPPQGWVVRRADGSTFRREKDFLEWAALLQCQALGLPTHHQAEAALQVLRATAETCPDWAAEVVGRRLYMKTVLALKCASRKIRLEEYISTKSIQ